MHARSHGIPQERRSKVVSQHSVKVGAAVRLAQEPSDEDQMAQCRCMRGCPPELM